MDIIISGQALFFSFCLIVSCSLIFTTTRSRRKSQGATALPPGPPRIPIIGNNHQVGGNPHRSFADLSKTYGPIISLKLGCLNSVVVSSPEAAREVLRTHDQILSNRKPTNLTRSINHHKYSVAWLHPSSDRWRMLRKLLVTQIFSPQRKEATKALRVNKVKELVSFVSKSSEGGEAVNISIDLGSYDSKTSINGFQNTVNHFMEIIAKPDATDYFPFLGFLDLQGHRKTLKVYTERLLRIFREFMDPKRAEKSLRNDIKDEQNMDFLDSLLILNEGAEAELDNNHIEHVLLDMFVAGTDTSSTTLEWAMAELLKNPKTMVKAQAEIDRVIDQNGVVQESDISNLPYLQAAIKETFRLHPTLPLLGPRTAESDVEVLGFRVPKSICSSEIQ